MEERIRGAKPPSRPFKRPSPAEKRRKSSRHGVANAEDRHATQRDDRETCERFTKCLELAVASRKALWSNYSRI